MYEASRWAGRRVNSLIATLASSYVVGGIAGLATGGNIITDFNRPSFADFARSSFLGVRASTWVTLLGRVGARLPPPSHDGRPLHVRGRRQRRSGPARWRARPRYADPRLRPLWYGGGPRRRHRHFPGALGRVLFGYLEVVHVLKDRLTKDASIVLFGGLAKERPYPGATTVSTVNGGVTGMVHTLACELGPVRVNAVHPGIVGDSPYWEGKPLDAVVSRTPIGRLVTMGEVVEAVVFLLECGGVNGVDLYVDGGGLLQ